MGVLKMLNELSILCGVEAGAVLYSSFEQQTIATLKNMPDFAQTRGMVDHDNFLEERFLKLGTQLLNLKKVNRLTEMALVMYQILQGHQLNISLSSEDLNDLGWAITVYLEEIDNKVETSSIPASAPEPSSSTNP
ncbi:MADS-box transcription factor PHERES 2-like [Ipomoea triloba]|nr:MADS-box transcription factor PHERES 2-like [Ipomoea triloba]